VEEYDTEEGWNDTEEGWNDTEEGWSDGESLNVDSGFVKTFFPSKTIGILLGFIVEMADSRVGSSIGLTFENTIVSSCSMLELAVETGGGSRVFGAVSELHPQLSV